MPSEYILKRSIIDGNRIQKIAKKLIEEATEDRELALDAYRYFKDMVDENSGDGVSKSQMVDCLKLAQSSKTNTIRILDMMVKMEVAKERASSPTDKNFSVFNQLDLNE
jgi:hypothetical protein